MLPSPAASTQQEGLHKHYLEELAVTMATTLEVVA
jgi:hypothetical protein